MARGGKQILDEMLKRESESTGISSLKISYNNVFGYYIEVRNAHKDKVPELKDILRWNKQLLGGTKEFVLFKVVDGVVNGRLWLCPLCAGDLKYKDGDYDNICCGGRYDEGTCKMIVLRT